MGLRNQLVYWLINRRIKFINRKRQFRNFDSVRTAGIVWNGNDHSAYESLVSILEQKQIKHTDLCFTHDPRKEESEISITKKDFSYWGTPKNKQVDAFINTEFDLLIDISLSSSVYMQVIRALSRASLKAGWSGSVPDYFDLSINVSKNPEPQFLVEQLTHYLNEINKTKP